MALRVEGCIKSREEGASLRMGFGPSLKLGREYEGRTVRELKSVAWQSLTRHCRATARSLPAPSMLSFDASTTKTARSWYRSRYDTGSGRCRGPLVRSRLPYWPCAMYFTDAFEGRCPATGTQRALQTTTGTVIAATGNFLGALVAQLDVETGPAVEDRQFARSRPWDRGCPLQLPYGHECSAQRVDRIALVAIGDLDAFRIGLELRRNFHRTGCCPDPWLQIDVKIEVRCTRSHPVLSTAPPSNRPASRTLRPRPCLWRTVFRYPQVCQTDLGRVGIALHRTSDSVPLPILNPAIEMEYRPPTLLFLRFRRSNQQGSCHASAGQPHRPSDVKPNTSKPPHRQYSTAKLRPRAKSVPRRTT